MDQDFIPSPNLIVLTKARVRDLFEFYFRNDQVRTVYKQLRQTQQHDLTPDGWVPISLLAGYKRVKTVTESSELILDAIRESSVLQVNAEGTHLRRTTQYSGEEMDEGRDAKTAYAKGFLKATPIGEIREFFKQFGTVKTVRWIRSLDDPSFKGGVFVEFESSNAVSRLLSQQQYRFGKRLITVTSRRVQVPTTKRKRETTASAVGKVYRRNRDDEGENGNFAQDDRGYRFYHDRVIHFAGVDPNTTHADIKRAFEKLGAEVLYVDYRRDETCGYVRLKKSVAARTVNAFAALGGLLIGNDEISLRSLTGKEEVAYWTIAHDIMRGNDGGIENKPAVNMIRQAHIGRKKSFSQEANTDVDGDEVATSRYDQTGIGSKRKTVAGVDHGDGDGVEDGIDVRQYDGQLGTSAKKQKNETEPTLMMQMFHKLHVTDENDVKQEPDENDVKHEPDAVMQQ
ncbi:hypothetical protein BC938DRAFT_480179 [Jimgerdemannia flammicorona]|uniref:HTH La-type RNA-binding domain-containing protein n=1 Tax=Jimgerdemannia flammicorona TaxID=994334 RepID=A0A433QJ84_9FUNG|nr:hypothetical protein BC938DRAFT_480179 [Jimgerdemannia flammicorona]